MFYKKFGMVAALLAALCCGALLVGCADGSGDDEEDRSDWAYSFDPEKYEWIDVTSDNMNDLVGLWSCEGENEENKVYWKEEISVKTSENSFIYAHINTMNCKNSPDGIYNSLKNDYNGEFTKFNDNKCLITITKENLTLEELYEELEMESGVKLSISTTKDRLMLPSGQPFAKMR